MSIVLPKESGSVVATSWFNIACGNYLSTTIPVDVRLYTSKRKRPIKADSVKAKLMKYVGNYRFVGIAGIVLLSGMFAQSASADQHSHAKQRITKKHRGKVALPKKAVSTVPKKMVVRGYDPALNSPSMEASGYGLSKMDKLSVIESSYKKLANSGDFKGAQSVVLDGLRSYPTLEADCRVMLTDLALVQDDVVGASGWISTLYPALSDSEPVMLRVLLVNGLREIKTSGGLALASKTIAARCPYQGWETAFPTEETKDSVAVATCLALFEIAWNDDPIRVWLLRKAEALEPKCGLTLTFLSDVMAESGHLQAAIDYAKRARLNSSGSMALCLDLKVRDLEVGVWRQKQGK